MMISQVQKLSPAFTKAMMTKICLASLTAGGKRGGGGKFQTWGSKGGHQGRCTDKGGERVSKRRWLNQLQLIVHGEVTLTIQQKQPSA